MHYLLFAYNINLLMDYLCIYANCLPNRISIDIYYSLDTVWKDIKCGYLSPIECKYLSFSFTPNRISTQNGIIYYSLAYE